MHSHIICIRVDATAEGAVYEVIAEPQEQQGQIQQEERREHPAQGPAEPSVEQQPEGKPRCTSYYFKIMTPIYVFNNCALGLEIV